MRETRSQATDFRSMIDEQGDKHLTAYAAKYNVLSTVLSDEQLGEFYEVILPGAFAEAVNDDCTCNIDHDDTHNLLGRTPNTLKLIDDAEGLLFDCLLPDTDVGKRALVHTDPKRKDISKCSFAFDVLDEEWDATEDGKPLRKLKKVTLYDVAIVIRPAYDFDTGLSVRSLDLAKQSTAPIEQADPHAWRRKMLDLQAKS